MCRGVSLGPKYGGEITAAKQRRTSAIGNLEPVSFGIVAVTLGEVAEGLDLVHLHTPAQKVVTHGLHVLGVKHDLVRITGATRRAGGGPVRPVGLMKGQTATASIEFHPFAGGMRARDDLQFQQMAVERGATLDIADKTMTRFIPASIS